MHQCGSLGSCTVMPLPSGTRYCCMREGEEVAASARAGGEWNWPPCGEERVGVRALGRVGLANCVDEDEGDPANKSGARSGSVGAEGAYAAGTLLLLLPLLPKFDPLRTCPL